MNQYLKSASKAYEKLKNKDYLINPISEIDGEIITEIVEIFKKLGVNNVVEILRNYKYQKDEEIRDQLLQVNIDFNSEKSEELKPSKDKVLKKQIIVLKEHNLMAKFIFGFKFSEDYDSDDNFLGKIILNPTRHDVTNLPIYANYEVCSNDEEEFEDLKKQIEEQLMKIGVEFIKF